MKVREAEAVNREAEIERQKKKVDERDKRSIERATELDASLATVEAMTAGLAVYDETSTSPGMRSTAAARSDSAWPDIMARMKAAPAAAWATAGRISKSLSEARAKAAADGLADARASARKELRDAFEAVRKASDAFGAVHQFALQIIDRLTGKDDRATARQNLEELTKKAVKETVAVHAKVPKAGLGDEAIK